MDPNNATRELVAVRLRLAREMAGLSQAQSAKQLGLHRPTVTEIEAGRRAVAAEELVQFADLYGVSVNWLTRGTKEVDVARERIELAARELAKLRPKDVDRVLSLLTALKASERKK